MIVESATLPEESSNYTLDYLNGMKSLRDATKMHKGMDTFILEHGKSFSVNKDTFKGKRMEQKMCFMNAYILAGTYSKIYTYTEGYACSVIPVHHAWVVDNDGNVIDPTWKNGRDYYGIPFKLKAIEQNLRTSGHYGCIIDDWRNNWPLVTGKIKIENVIEKKFYLIK